MMFAHRLDFGFGNPNTAGAFFAVLALSVFLIPARARWADLLRFLFAGVCTALVLLTASRAALLGLVLGALGAWAASGFPRPKAGWGTIIAIAACAALFGAKAASRAGSLSPGEGSTASRLKIYTEVPAMIVAAPGGWGAGDAASAYENWFQAPGDSSHFKNLLSTHATWVVERGIAFLALYLLGWAFAFWVANPAARGVIIAWGISCAFSHVGAFWWMWVLPVLAVSVSLFRRPPRSAAYGAAVFGGAAALFFGVLLAGWISSKGISYDGRVLRAGDGEPEIWFLSPEIPVLGKTCGKRLRELARFAVARDWDGINNPRILVLSGLPPLPADPKPVAHLVWFNPPEKIDPVLAQLVGKAGRKTVFWGGLRTDANPAALKAWFETLPDSEWATIRGRGKYLGDEISFVTKMAQNLPD